jgi:hypothetical protein
VFGEHLHGFDRSYEDYSGGLEAPDVMNELRFLANIDSLASYVNCYQRHDQRSETLIDRSRQSDEIVNQVDRLDHSKLLAKFFV